MGITITTKRFATPTSTGEVTWDDIKLGELTPLAVMIFANHADENGTVEIDLSAGVGFADATREGFIGTSAEDAVTTTNTGFNNDASNVIDTIVNDSVQVTANFVSFGANEIVLNFTAIDSDAQLFTVVFFAGDDLQVYMDALVLAIGVTDITAPGFEPDLLLAVAGDTQGHFSFGACINDGSETQMSLGRSSLDGVGTSNINAELSTNQITQSPQGGSNFQNIVVSDFDANGFTADSLKPNKTFYYLALKFGGAASVNLRSFDSPTTTGDDVRTGVGFIPQFVLLGLMDVQSVDVVNSGDDAGAFGISVFTPDAEFANAWADEDAQTTTDTQSLADDQAINFASDDGVTQHAATFVSMNADGHTLNYSVADGTVRKWFEVTIEANSIGLAGETDTALVAVPERAEVVDLATETDTVFVVAVIETVLTGKALDARLASANLQDTLSNNPPTRLDDINEDPDSDDGEWWTAIDALLATDVRFSFPTPSSVLIGDQKFKIRVRKTASPLNPTIDIELWEGGGFVALLLNDQSITSIDPGQVIEVDWHADLLADPAGGDVEVRIVSTPGA